MEDHVNYQVVIAGHVANEAGRIGVPKAIRLSQAEVRQAVEDAIIWHEHEGLSPAEAARSAVAALEFNKKLVA